MPFRIRHRNSEREHLVTLTEDLRGLMDALSIGKAHLVGFSMGGNEITKMAGMHADRVDRLVYLDSAYDWADPASVAAFQKVPPSFFPIEKDSASLDEYRKFIKSVWFPSVKDPSVVEAYIRNRVVIQADGRVQPKESNDAGQALAQTLLTSPRDYTKVQSPALAIYAATMVDCTDRQRPNVRADWLAFEEKYMAPFRAASVERAKRQLPDVEVMNVPCSHRD